MQFVNEVRNWCNGMLNEQWPTWEGIITVNTYRLDGTLKATQTFRNQICNGGLNLVRDGLIGATTNTQITWVAVGSAPCTLTTGLTSGQTGITALAVTALPFAVTASTLLTLVSGTTTQQVTVTGTGASSGATSIPVVSFTSAAAFGMGTAVMTSPAATDLGLNSEQFRKQVTTQSQVGTGQGQTTVYLAPSEATTFTIQEIGWFGGATASSAANSGILLARVLYNTSKTNLESLQVQRIDTL